MKVKKIYTYSKDNSEKNGGLFKLFSGASNQSTDIWFVTEDNKVMYFMLPLVNVFEKKFGSVEIFEEKINESTDTGNCTYRLPDKTAYIMLEVSKVNSITNMDKYYLVNYNYSKFTNQKVKISKNFNNYQDLINELSRLQ